MEVVQAVTKAPAHAAICNTCNNDMPTFFPQKD